VLASDEARAPDVTSSAEPLRAVPDPLTLDQALALFRRHGFDLLLADVAVAKARGDLQAAAAFPNPVVSAAGGHSFNYDPGRCSLGGCSATAFNVNLSDEGLLLDFVIGKRDLRVQVAAAALDAAQRARADAERLLLPTVRELFTQAVLATAMLGVAREAVRTAQQTYDRVHGRAGGVSEADETRAELAEIEAERLVDSATERVSTAKAALAALLGARGAYADFQVSGTPPPFVDPPVLRTASAASLSALALDHRADVAAARARVQRADAGLALARRERIPDIAFIATYQQEGTGTEAIQPPTATFGLSLPLPLLYQNQGEILAAEAEAQRRQLETEKTEAQVGADVSAAFAAFQSARSRVLSMESRLLDRSRHARDLLAARHGKGLASLFEYLDAQRRFVTAQTDYYEDLSDYWTALYKLEQSVGVELAPE
jgi:cobalt-zinc-cadmium efflux system outer membrane protein